MTLNVAKITAYAQAGLSAVTTVTGVLAQFPARSTYTAPLAVAETLLTTALANFTTAAGASVTVTYDRTSLKTEIDLVLSGIEQVAALIASIAVAMATQTALGISSSTVSQVKLTSHALSTIVSTFRALLSTSTAKLFAPAPQLAMSESQALRALRA